MIREKNGVRIGFRGCRARLKRWRGRTGLQRWASAWELGRPGKEKSGPGWAAGAGKRETGPLRWAKLGGGASWAELGSGGLPGGFLLSYFSLLLQTSLKLFEFKFDFEFKPHSIN